jgi:hypothetical protein
MYATVRVYSGSPALADALVENQDEVKRIIQGIDGFKAYYLVKTADGAASVSVHENQSGAEESNQAAAGWLRENLPDLSVSAPQVSAEEVVIDI